MNAQLEPRGVRLNNPGCIRRNDAIRWRGQTAIPQDPDFVSFIAPEWGIRAICRILMSYQREGIATLRQAVYRWAPPSDGNPTDRYLSNLCNACSLEADAPILLTAHLPELVTAIGKQECGIFPYPNSTLELGISLSRED